MKRLTLLPVLAGVLALVSSTVYASPLGVPAGLYPTGAHVTYRPALTNHAMDCMWGYVCEDGLSLFHVNTQDTLHRLGGWAQFAGIRHQDRTTMAFELFASRYDSEPNLSGTPWSELAFIDLQKAIDGQGYHLVPDGIHLLTTPTAGGALVALRRDGRQDLVVMAAWSGSTEIEGIALYEHSPAAKQTAWTSLARQIERASAPTP
jgi:hypothetical protein